MILPGKITKKTLDGMASAGLKQFVYRGVLYDVERLRRPDKPKKRAAEVAEGQGLDEPRDSDRLTGIGKRRDEARESEAPETDESSGEG